MSATMTTEMNPELRAEPVPPNDPQLLIAATRMRRDRTLLAMLSGLALLGLLSVA